MNKAFVLGAGLGTRLRPLTAQLPKPLIPVFNRPLITYAFDHLLGVGVREFIVNTHHLPEKFADAFPSSAYRKAPITLRHEPVFLETAGGIANIADLVSDGDFIVYNGDILTDLPLAPLIKAHTDHENIITLVLRSSGPGLHIALDDSQSRVTDIRNMLGTGAAGTHQFTGIYAVNPEFISHLTPGKIESVIPIFLKLIAAGRRIGAVVIDEGRWWDLGDRGSYLDAHREILALEGGFPPYAKAPLTTRDPSAKIAASAKLTHSTIVGAGADIGADSMLEDCILWPDATVARGAKLTRCIVRSGMTAQGTMADTDI